MQTVETADGTRYLLLKRSSESSLVRDPETGEERYVSNDSLERIDRSPLETAAVGVPAPVRRLVTSVPDSRALGLLLEIDSRGPMSVRALLTEYDLCESDLHGLIGEFRAAGLIEETDVDGERGYTVSAEGRDVLDRLRS